AILPPPPPTTPAVPTNGSDSTTCLEDTLAAQDAALQQSGSASVSPCEPRLTESATPIDPLADKKLRDRSSASGVLKPITPESLSSSREELGGSPRSLVLLTNVPSALPAEQVGPLASEFSQSQSHTAVNGTTSAKTADEMMKAAEMGPVEAENDQ